MPSVIRANAKPHPSRIGAATTVRVEFAFAIGAADDSWSWSATLTPELARKLAEELVRSADDASASHSPQSRI